MIKKDFINSPNITETEILELKKLFPKFFSEWAFDLDWFREYLNWLTVNDKEFYRFEWTGKQESKMIANKPSKNTLLPDEANSKNWNETENIFIEWDNLEVLKLLQNKYFGQIKMIYIDPPYNKDKDFVYKDTWKDSLEDYLLQTGQVDEDGETTTEKETTGRKHSNWLNMIYPRLILARRLLREDWVIFVSIDDDEVHNLRKVMDEVFGEECFIASLIWEQWKKSIANFVWVNHEYVLIYWKNNEELKKSWLWKQKKEWLNEIYNEYEKLKKKFWNDFIEIEKLIKEFYNKLDENHPSKSSKHYNNVDERWLYFPDNMSQWNKNWTIFNIIHPITWKVCKAPAWWYRYSKETLELMLKENKIHFWKDENIVCCTKRYLKETEWEVPPSVFYRDWRWATKILSDLLWWEFFDFPKDHRELKRFFSITTKENDIILDFFAWSWTTAHAVMELNKEDEWNRKFICVQLPEKTDKNSIANKEWYEFISQITRERIKRAGEKIKSEWWENVDIWFRAFKLSESNFTYMSEKYEIDENTDIDQLELQMQREIEESWFRDGRTQNDIIYELIIREWYSFNSKIEMQENGIYKVIDTNDNFFYFIAEIKTDEELQKFIKANLGIIDKKNINLFALEEKLNESQRVTLSNYFKLVNL